MSHHGANPRLPFGNKNVQRAPVPLDLAARQGQTDIKRPLGDKLANRNRLAVSQSVPRSRSTLAVAGALDGRNLALTPKKRSVPVDDVHCRNVVNNSPSKRSRSSTDDNSTSQRTDSTGSGSLVRAVGGITMDTANAANVPLAPQHNTLAPQREAAAELLRPTTRRIAKTSCINAADRAQREKAKNDHLEKLRAHYKKEFPKYIFYVDDPNAVGNREVVKDLQRLGGTIEPFFSKKVTHLIVSPKTPTGYVYDEPRLKTSRSTSALKGSKHVPIHSDRNPFEVKQPLVAQPNDVIAKAKGFGMAVWDLERAHKLIDCLAGAHGPAQQKISGKQELSKMLEQEKLLGTAERDPTAQRAGFYYFPKGSHYFLVDDATGEHRHIMAREFTRPADKSDKAEKAERKHEYWPMIYGELEGRCPFTRYDCTREDILRRKKATQSGTLRRTVSLNNFTRNRSRSASPRPESRDVYARAVSPYQAASGNTLQLTSHITSASAIGSSASFTHMAPHDKRLAMLGRRAHIRGGSGQTAPSGLAISNSGYSGDSRPATPDTHSGFPTVSAPFRGGTIRRMLGMDQVRTNPHYMDGMRRTVSTSVVPRPPAEKVKKEGHCENCRANFADFEAHVLCEKHREFATDPRNFLEIDELIARVHRPMLDFNESVLGAPAASEYAYDDAAMNSADLAPQWEDYHLQHHEHSGDADVSGNVDSVSPSVLHSAATSYFHHEDDAGDESDGEEDSAMAEEYEQAADGYSGYAGDSVLEEMSTDAVNDLRRTRASHTPATSPVADEAAVIQEVKTARPGYVPSMMETRSRRPHLS